MASGGLLSPRVGLKLNTCCNDAIIRGNDLHDDMFDHDGVNVNVYDAVEMAGKDCGVLCRGQQKDLSGRSAKQWRICSMTYPLENKEVVIYFSLLVEQYF